MNRLDLQIHVLQGHALMDSIIKVLVSALIHMAWHNSCAERSRSAGSLALVGSGTVKTVFLMAEHMTVLGLLRTGC